MSDAADTWRRAGLALACLAQDPSGLGGLVIRARPGPVRDALVKAIDMLPHPVRRIHPTISDDQLFGGVDIAATLAAGTVVQTRGFPRPRTDRPWIAPSCANARASFRQEHRIDDNGGTR